MSSTCYMKIIFVVFSILVNYSVCDLTIIQPDELAKVLNYPIPAKYANYGEMKYGISNVKLLYKFSMAKFISTQKMLITNWDVPL